MEFKFFSSDGIFVFQSLRSVGSFCFCHQNRTDDCMRANEGTLVALDTFIHLPFRYIDRDTAFFVSGSAAGESTVDIFIKGADRQVIAFQTIDWTPALRPSYERYVLEDDENLNPIVKAADKLAAHIKCIEELKAGNLEFSTAAAQTLQALKATGREEVDWFLDNCLEPFSRNIDQM